MNRRGAPASAERVMSGDVLPDDEPMHVLGTLVGIHRLQVQHVSDDGIFVDDAVGAENVARLAGGVERDPDVVHLRHADLLGAYRPLLLQPAETEAEELTLGDLRDHRHQLALDELVSGDRLGEHEALARILERAVVAGARRSEGAPGDAVAGLRQAGERAAHRARPGQPVLERDSAALEEEFRRDRRAQAELALHLPRREPWAAALDQEAVHALPTVLPELRPDHGDVRDVAVRDPPLRPVEDVLVALAPAVGPRA